MEATDREKWGFNRGMSVFSNLMQGEAVFLELDGWINEAFQSLFSAQWHQLLLHSSPGRIKAKIVFLQGLTLSPLVS